MGTIEGRPGAGATSRAGWATCPSRSPRPPRKPARSSSATRRWRRSCPGEAVILEDGTCIAARTIVSNADPRTTLGRLRDAAPAAFAERVARLADGGSGPEDQLRAVAAPRVHCSRPGRRAPSSDGDHRAQPRRDPGRIRAQPSGRARAAMGELYFHTAYDPSVAPEGRHVMSVFAEYAPYTLASGHLGRAPRGGGRRGIRRDRPLRSRHRRVRRRSSGARAAGHRARRRPVRRPHLPGRVPPRPDVGPPILASHPDAGPLPVRGEHPSRAAASWRSTAATARWPCSPTLGGRSASPR